MAKVDKVQAAKNRARLKAIADAAAKTKANAKVKFEADIKRKELFRKNSKYDNRGFNDKQTGSQITSGYFADTMPNMSLGYFKGTILDGTNKVIQNKKFLGANGKYYPTKAEADKNNKQDNLKSRVPNGSSKDQDVKNFGYFGPADNSVIRTRNDITRKPVQSGTLGLSNRKVETGLNKGKDMMMMDGMTNTSNQRKPRNSDITVRTSTVEGPNFGKSVIDYKGGEIKYSNINPMDLGGYNQETKRKVSFAISRGTDTLTGMNLTNNYANPNFGASNSIKKVSSSPFSNPGRVSTAAQSARSKGASASIKSSIKSMESFAKGPSISPGIFSPIYSGGKGGAQISSPYMGALPPSINRSVTKAVTAPVISSYGNFANPAFSAGVTAKTKISKPTMTQDQFSQNIKLVSNGFSLGDTVERERLAQSKASSSARIKKASRANAASATAFNNSPASGIGEANRILAEQGANYRIKSHTVRRRRGRWSTNIVKYYVGPTIYRSYTYTNSRGNSQRQIENNLYAGALMGGADPIGIINAYRKQKAVAQFGRENTELKQVGPAGNYAADATYAARVEAFAGARKSVVDQYIDPLDSIYGYATITDAQLGDITKYGSDLTKNVGEYDSNIDILQQGITKVNVARGKAPGARKAGVFGPTAYDSIEAREKPFDLTIANTSKDLASINTKLSGVNTTIANRNSLQLNLNNLLGTSAAYTLDEAYSRLGDKITAQKAAVVAAQENVARLSTPEAQQAENYRLQRMSRGQKRSYQPPVYAAQRALSSQQGYLGTLQAAQSQITRDGEASFGSDKINSGIIATSGNLTMRGNATGKRNWYRGATGYTTIHIPKDKIPASGKVIVEATVSYSSGYKGPTHADTTFGRVQGSGTFKKELPVDANGNIQIYATMYGTNRGQDAVSTVSGIKVIDPTSTQHGAKLYGQINDLTATKTSLSSVLQENQGTKSYFDNAQLFLTGKSNDLKDKKGSTIASYIGGNLNVSDKTQFQDLFGSNFDSETFGATRDVYVPLNTLSARKASKTAEKQSILAREATRGETLSTAKKASLTSQANSLRGQAATIAKAASVQAAIAANNPSHSKIEVQNMREAQQRVAQRAASSLSSQAASLNAQAKAKETYRDTGIDPTRPISSVVASQVSALDMELGTIASTESFLTGKTNKLMINDVNIASRGQAGKITVSDASYFANLGLNVAPITKQGVAPPNTKKLAALEATLEAREKQQKQLIEQLKVVQTERITEQATARVQQINELVRKRAINRRDASKMKATVAQETNAQRAAVKGVDDSIPLPDITAFDADLRSEAQQILDSTGGMVKGIKKSTMAGRLRQVTRSRKPQGSVIGSVLARGTTVPRPSNEFPNRQTSTTLGSQNAIIRNPFIG